ncbi:MAG: PilZ domain-containing protein [Nitrospinales bacterium]
MTLKAMIGQILKREVEQTDENIENRKSTRFNHTSSLQVKDIESRKVHNARMCNYSKEGVYFESDSVLNPGMQVYIGIQNSPYASLPDVLEYHRAEIMWRKKLKRSFYRFGYGVKLGSLDNKQNLKSNDVKNAKNLRKHPRKSYKQSTMFSTRKGIFEGSTKDISASGVFIMSKKAFEVGEILTLALQYNDGKNLKIKGQIVWTNEEGFGIKFLTVD